MKVSKNKTSVLVSAAQLLLFLCYLKLNIANIGEGGIFPEALLIIFMLFSIYLFINFTRIKFLARIEFFLVILIILWIAFRALLDTNSFDSLKSVTIGTTGGVLTFFLVGVITGVHLEDIVRHQPNRLTFKILFFANLLSLVFLIINFIPRLREDIFLLIDTNGEYQRTGNFMSINFIIFSYCFIRIATAKTRLPIKSFLKISYCFLFIIYLIAYAVLGQIFGSNSATGVILGVGALSLMLVMSLPTSFDKLVSSHAINFYRSKYLLRRLFFVCFFLIAFITACLLFLERFLGYSILQLNVFSFGDGTISSVSSRIELFKINGVDQLDYAPFLGHYDVARMVTGNGGAYIHMLFPNVMSKLGIIGLILMIGLLLIIFWRLNSLTSKSFLNAVNYDAKIISIFYSFVVLFIVLFANISVDLTWSVFWFTLGISSQIFRIGLKLKK